MAVLDLRGILTTLWRRRGLIAMSLLAGAALGIVVAFAVPARYLATSEVFSDPRNLEVLQNELSPTTGNGDEATIVSQSQVLFARSTAVLNAVVHALALDKDPDFGTPRPTLFDLLKTTLLGPADATSGETPEVKAIRALAHDLTVRRTDKTFVIEIAVKTRDPDLSAQIANAVASAFIKEVSRTRSDEVRGASTALDARLAELRTRLKGSDDAVERYRRQHDLIGAGGRLISDQQLGELTSQLSNADNAVAAAKARLDSISQMRRDGALPGDTDESVKSTALAAIRATLAQADRAAAEADVTYGARFPMRHELAARVAAARQQLDAEIVRINKAAEADYRRATATARQLSRKLATMKETSGQANEASVELRELEREAGSNRAVYEAFLNRTKDLQQRLYLDTVNARIVTVAMPPLTRAGLSKTPIMAMGLMGGLLIGLLLALLRDQTEQPTEHYVTSRRAF